MIDDNGFRERRAVLADTITAKAAILLSSLEETEARITDLTCELVAQTRTISDAPSRENAEDRYNDQLAKTIAGLTAARERTREALFHAVTALHHGDPVNCIRIEAINNES